MLWKWLKRESTTLADFGDPQHTADYALCTYGGLFQILLTGGQLRVPSNSSKWTPRGTRGWKYDDPTASPEGARKLRLLRGDIAQSKATLMGSGAALPDLVLPIGPRKSHCWCS